LDSCVRICKFIKKHPYLAWDIDCGYKQDIWDLADVEHPFFGFYKERLQYWWAEICYNRFNKKYLKLVNLIVEEIGLIAPEIIDENKDTGWKAYPRYVIRCEGVRGEKLERGEYAIEFEKELSPKLLKKIISYERSRTKKINQAWKTADIDLYERLFFWVRKHDKSDSKKITKGQP